MIPDLMCRGRRDQRGQAFEQLTPLHHAAGRPVSPWHLEPMGKPAIADRLEATRGQRGTSGRAA